MAHMEAAGYRILSFKYSPVQDKKDEHWQRLRGGPDGDGVHGEGANPLPSLSSLMTSLQEIEGPADAKAEEPPAATASASEPKDHDAPSTPTPTPTPTATATAAAPAPLTEFHLFGDLPTELRLKIWNLTFLPRVVELLPIRPNYSPGRDVRRPRWKSGCSNPAALSVSLEAREFALEHFRIAFPLALIHPAQEMATPRLTNAARGDAGLYNLNDGYVDGKGRLLRRTLYVSPAEDTVCLLGQSSDLMRLSHVLQSFREADPRGLGISRLGLSVRGWGYGGSAVMMKNLGRTVLADLEQLVLFMYVEHRPPAEWRVKGDSTEGEMLDRFRKDGNKIELVACDGSNAWYAYQIWSGGKGRQFWDDDGNIMRIGRNEIKVMDLEFKEGW